MSINSRHTLLPPNRQIAPESDGNLEFKLSVTDVVQEDNNTNFLLGYGLGKGHHVDPTGQINGTIMHTDSFVKMIYLVSEGSIKGEVDGHRSFYLNNTPLVDAAGNLNFKGVQIQPFYGQQDQKFPAMFGKSGNTISVGAEVKFGTDYVFSVDEEITSVNIIMRLPYLAVEDNKGNISAGSVNISFIVNGKALPQKNIQCLATGEIEIAFLLNLNYLDGQKTIHVVRNSPDSDDPKIQNKTYISSYTPILDYRLNYAGRAGFCITFESKQYGTQLPDLMVDVYGLDIIQIPDNYDPETRVYTGIWSGRFKTGYTNNPVWILYTILTNKLWGAGDYISPEDIDKFQFYTFGQYCDELVPDLDGGKSPRFTFNGEINSQESVSSLVRKFQTVFFGALYFSHGQIKMFCDAKEDPSFIITNSDVVDGEFNYASLPFDKLTNTVVVSYNDIENNMARTTVTVKNDEYIDFYGCVVKKEIDAFGCTNRTQAMRLGLNQLASDESCKDTCTFKMSYSGYAIEAGMVGRIIDNDNPRDALAGGRILSINLPTIVLDRAVTMISGVSYTLDTYTSNGVLVSISVNTVPGTSDTITVDSGFNKQISALNAFVFRSPEASTKNLWRIMSISDLGDKTYEVMANFYSPDKYDKVDALAPIDNPPTTKLPELQAPNNIIITSRSQSRNVNTILNSVNFGWDRIKNIAYYEYQYKTSGGQFSQLQRTNSNRFNVTAGDGEYVVKVRTVDALHRRSIFTQKSFRISAGDLVPKDVTSFSVQRSGNSLIFNWDAATDYDKLVIDHYEIRTGTAWDDAYTVADIVGNSYSLSVNYADTYMIKAVTIAGVESVNAASVGAIPKESNILLTDDYKALGFPAGEFSNFIHDSLNQRLEMRRFNYGTWQDTTGQWNTLTEEWSSKIEPGLVGHYTTPVKDLGGIEVTYIHIDASKDQVVTDLSKDSMATVPVSDLHSNWLKDGNLKLSKVTISIRKSDDNVIWSAWANFVAGQYKGRYFQYRISLEVLSHIQLLYITGFTVKYDIPDNPERSVGTTDINGQFVYNYSTKYHNPDLIVIGSPTNPSDNVTVKTIAKSITQATFLAIDQSTGNPKSGILINIYVRGY